MTVNCQTRQVYSGIILVLQGLECLRAFTTRQGKGSMIEVCWMMRLLSDLAMLLMTLIDYSGRKSPSVFPYLAFSTFSLALWYAKLEGRFIHQ